MSLFARIQQPAPERSPESKRLYMLRKSLLAFRFHYYILAEPIVSDFVYDKREAELKALLAAHPELDKAVPFHAECPSRTVGSDDPYSYPAETEQFAVDMLEAHEKIRHAVLSEDIDPAFLVDFSE